MVKYVYVKMNALSIFCPEEGSTASLHYLRKEPCVAFRTTQCGQLSNLLLNVASFSDDPSNFIFRKHLATNLAILKNVFANFY